MNTISTSAADLSEHFDSETLALLDAIEVDLPEFGDADLDIAFGTPLEMYEFVTPGELARFDAAAGPRGGRTKAQDEVGFEFAARRDAARDIVAADPSITVLVRERLVDALIPHAAQLRIAPPAAASLPIAA
ncbi:hypothetical protein ACH4UM_38505 [Streptomyces sp. NPDC020801]|uniref:hypothetical protein n=1 Tax=Streptomyces sp. NPDC020801 TaxID=3365093 RepID=UPI00378D9F60